MEALAKVRSAVRFPTPTVVNLQNNFLIISAFFSVLVMYTSIPREPIDKFSSPQTSSVIFCKNYTMAAEQNGFIDFMVSFKNDYQQEDTVVGSNNEKDHVVLSGNEVIWYGSYDINANKLPEIRIYYQKGKFFKTTPIRRYFDASCPQMNRKLTTISFRNIILKNVHHPVSEAETSVSIETTNNLNCINYKLHVSNNSGHTDVAVFFRNPHFNKEMDVETIPIQDEESTVRIVHSGTYIILYTRLDLQTQSNLPNAIVIYRRDGLLHSFYDMECSPANKILEKLSWKYLLFLDYKRIGKTILISVSFFFLGVFCGTFTGDWVARFYIRRLIARSSPPY